MARIQIGARQEFGTTVAVDAIDLTVETRQVRRVIGERLQEDHRCCGCSPG
ncbi:hypothetical protein HBB16_04550 [Pseudonocardia sp. MCCB 268]|nr:hypothetical protein [Pseudonocardia cytotoxica]